MEELFDEPFDPAVERRLDDILIKVMDQYRVPGAIAGVRCPGKGRWVQACGKSDIESDRDMEPFDRVRIASVTKSFTSTLVLQLFDDGLLDLEQTVEEILPDIEGLERIKIRQLGNNTSGLFDYLQDESFQEVIKSDPMRSFEPRQLVEIGLAHDPYFAPGAGYHYSNTNFVLLGLVAEELAGRPLEGLVAERIIEPLGLRNTEFPLKADVGSDFSHGYRPAKGDGGFEDVTCLNPSIAWAAGGMTSNLADLEKWARVLGRGELISDEAHQEQLSWVESADYLVDFERYGFGVTCKGEFVGHEGHLLGYNNAMYYLTARDATIVVLLNRYFGEESVAGTAFLLFARSLFPGVFPHDRCPTGT